ncbi:MAG: GTPase Era [Proteobacteria bacterium]|nr:GTPase Era [Pseudomonadota bacterium]
MNKQPKANDTTQEQQKCAVIALIGAPNAGKSTLINTLVGQKIAIATHKAQTTRKNIRGIMFANTQTQLVFVDTPGIFKPDGLLEKSIVKEAWRALDGCDMVCLLIDANRKLDENYQIIIEHLKRQQIKSCAVLTKIDSLPKALLIEKALQLGQHECFEKIFMISALKKSGIQDMIEYLAQHSPASAWLYPEEELTDSPLREMAAEITREQVFLQLHQEIPYEMKVETDLWKDVEGVVEIYQTLYVIKESQQKIVIGSKGQRLKSIGINARKQIQHRLGIPKVRLFLHVKVRPNWIENEAGIHTKAKK